MASSRPVVAVVAVVVVDLDVDGIGDVEAGAGDGAEAAPPAGVPAKRARPRTTWGVSGEG